MKIIIGEDRKEIILLVKEILEHKGHEIIEAHDGAEVIFLADGFKVDLILMDIMMKGMTGAEAIEKLKKNNNTKHIPIIALTARAQAGEREEILKLGFDDYLAKPFMPEDLINHVNKFNKPQ